MKVLITGGGGFIGSHLSDAFLARGDEVIALDIAADYKVRHNLDNPRFKYLKGSIMEFELLAAMMRKCDLCYHLGAVVGVEHYVGDPMHVLNVNVNGTQNVLKAASLYDRKVVFASTSEIYGKSKDTPFREDGDRVLGSTRIDRWCYSTSKAVGEHFCFAYQSKLGLPISIVRFFNLYGPRLDKLDVGRVITIFMGQLLRGEDITVIGDGKQTRAFTYIGDAIKAIVKAGMEKEAEGGIFNIGTDRETTILELAETMIRIGGGKSKIRFVQQEKVYGKYYEDVPRRYPDITRMRTILGVEPSTSLEDGLRATIDWFKKEVEATPSLLHAAK